MANIPNQKILKLKKLYIKKSQKVKEFQLIENKKTIKSQVLTPNEIINSDNQWILKLGETLMEK